MFAAAGLFNDYIQEAKIQAKEKKIRYAMR